MILRCNRRKGAQSGHLVFLNATDARRVAVWSGSESSGISDLAVKRSKMCVNIPMLGMIENLNLGTTSGIVLYEITKQRREYLRMYRYRNRRGRNFIA